MSSVNLATRQLAIKIVYYGPGLGGKTTSLQCIHRSLAQDTRGQLIQLATGQDRTLYFDFLPIRVPKLGGYEVRVQLYTVPGQVHYNATRKLVLSGADGVVFVADSQADRMTANLESMANMLENLREQGVDPNDIPLLIQYNKSDAPTAMTLAEMEATLNKRKLPARQTVATTGEGVFEALKQITRMVLSHLKHRGSLPDDEAQEETAPRREDNAAAGEPVPTLAGTAQSFSDLANAIEQLEPAVHHGDPGSHESPPRNASGFSCLVSDAHAIVGLTRAERAVERNDWTRAIESVDLAYGKMATALCGTSARDPLVLTSLMCGIPAENYLRFNEMTGRTASGGGVSSTDALFAIFFLTDVALRLDARRRVEP